jgi:cytochrome c oxidase subunit 3
MSMTSELTSPHAADRPPSPRLAQQFDTMEAQVRTGTLGMWLFLASEVLFFTGLFTAYAVYRANHQDMFAYGQHFLDWRMGALNTIVLICSSLSAAWAVRCAQLDDRRGLDITLTATILLGCTFMVVKYFEYSHKIHAGVVWGEGYAPTQEFLSHLPAAVQTMAVPDGMGRFFSIYYMMTGLHGIHVVIGIGLFIWLRQRARRADFTREYNAPVDGVALYWHLVDIIWIFLFPLFYLIG